jgi:hypothetical protein
MDKMLIPRQWADMLPGKISPLDVRDHLDEMQTLKYLDLEFFEHARWSLRYRMAVEDHRGNYWVTMYEEPATENNDDTANPFLFTRLVDGEEYVVFDRAERYEVTHWRYRPVVDENGF